MFLAETDFNAWVALAGVGVGAFVTLLIQFWTHRQTKQFLAAEKRLEVHQKAYELWWKIVTGYHNTDTRIAALNECQTFYNSHCLYLGNRTRKVFNQTLGSVAVYSAYREMWQRGDDRRGKAMEKLAQEINDVLQAISSDVELPDLNDDLVDTQKLLAIIDPQAKSRKSDSGNSVI